MAKVYIPHKVNKNLSGLDRFGPIEYLSKGKGLFPDLTQKEIEEVLDEIYDNLESVTDDDYIVMIGDPSLLYYIGYELGIRWVSPVVIKYDKQNDGFYTVELPDEEDEVSV